MQTRLVRTAVSDPEVFRAVFEHASCGILVYRDGVYVEANPAMCRILGLTRDQVVGRPSDEFLTILERSAVVKHVAAHGGWLGRFAFVNEQDDTRIVECNVTGLAPDCDTWLAIVTDVTEQQTADAVVAHELRGALTPMLAAVRVLQQNTVVRAVPRFLEIIYRNARLLNRLVGDLLDMSRIERGELELKRQLVDLATVIRREADSIRTAYANDKRIEITTTLQKPVWVDGDADRLCQVARNILLNAVNITPTGGAIAVTLRSDAFGNAVLRITDSGPGIPADSTSRIFEPYYRLNSSRKSAGLGLGLYITKQLTEMHRGSITADPTSETGGAAFTVRIPLAAHAGS
jgi:PAS domain S-box-containing protein